MKTSKFQKLATAASFIGLFGFAGYAQAVGTLAGTNVDNVATVTYEVNGTEQEFVNSSPTGNSTSGAAGGVTTRFVVDRVANLNVVANAPTTAIGIPAGFDSSDGIVAAYALVFDVTNTGNDDQDLGLFLLDNTAGDDDDGISDEFDAANFRMFIDDDGTPGLSAGDQEITFLDEIAPDVTTRVYVLGSAPVGETIGNNASVTLVARLQEAGSSGVEGAVTVSDDGNADTHNDIEDTVAGDLAEVDIVLNDGLASEDAGFPNAVAEYDINGDPDTAGNGQFADTAHYVIIGTSIEVTKTSTVISDPFNGASPDAKRIPDAVVRYSISVENLGLLPAESVVITDSIPLNTSYVPDSVTIDTVSALDASPAVTHTVVGGGSPDTLSVSTGTVAAAATTTITFDVTID